MVGPDTTAEDTMGEWQPVRPGGARRAWRQAAATVAAALALAGCGGGSDGAPTGSASCDVASQKAWLRSYMQDWYLWAGSAPDPDPAPYATVADYFDALRFPGAGPVPRDHWSYLQDSASYNQFFAEGRTMGYGIFVNGLELQLPLRVRMTEPLSPAGAALQRGDIIVSANGRTAAELVAANDFSVFSAAKEGDQLSLVIDRGGVQTPVVLTAATFTLTPVPVARVLTLAGGTKAGYVMLKDFITQAEAPLASALADFRAANATELIVDLRYNGGGRISTANVLASQIAGALHQGQTFTELRYNAAHQASNSRFTLTAAPGPAFGRVVVLTGPRTCSASELVVNGLKPYAQVVTIGGATCGKPFGFSPVESCATTVSAVNFQSYNASGQSDYYDGIAPTCPATDPFTGTLGDPAEGLTAAAATYLATDSCPTAAAGPTMLRALALRERLRRGIEPGEHPGMVAAP
jgi:C-terminal processing protease CtpA/Prc